MKTLTQRLAALALGAVLALGATTVVAQTTGQEAMGPEPSPRPVLPAFRLLLSVPEARQPVSLERVTVSADIVGTLARSRIELVLHNPNERALEAELQFPLLEGQTITAFALDIHGHLRPASPVDKARGQQVFEDIVRRGADPALLEKTQGNNFKLRVYPLPPKGERRVALVISETLTPGKDGRLSYRLPLGFGDQVGELSLDLHVAGVVPGKLALSPVLEGAVREVQDGDAVVRWLKKGWNPKLAGSIAQLSWQAAKTEMLVADRFEEDSFFYGDVPVNVPAAPRVAPRTLALIWDASGSGNRRDHAREFALLDLWFKQLGNVDVSLVVARDQAEVPRNFSVKSGNWQALRTALEAVPYDGATNPASWAVPDVVGEVNSLALLFSDGLANWGEAGAPASRIPLYAVNAAAGADPVRLRALAEASGGAYLDLLRISPVEAATELGLRRTRLVALSGAGAEALVSASAYPEGGHLMLAGKLTQPVARVTLILESPTGERLERHLAVKAAALRPYAASADVFPGVAAQHWAGLTLGRLEADRNLHRAEIRRLGQRFGLVTEETSLIILESLADYLRYEILPPAGDLRVEYEQQLAQRQAGQVKSRSAQLDSIAPRFAEKVKWWETKFPKGEPPKPTEDPDRASRPMAVMAPAPNMDPAAMSAAQARYLAEQTARMSERRVPAEQPPPVGAVQRAERVVQVPSGQSAQSMQEIGSDAMRAPVPDAGPEAAIHLQQWQPDAAYARRLRDASDTERYAIYLDERGSHEDSTAFFLDAANIFFDHGQTDLAVRILSNLAEMNLENRHILRILAYSLRQAGQVRLALPLLKRVRELAPDEPQSSRDLGLAYAANGQSQAAIDVLWEAVCLPWRADFADIDLIALAELNAIAARTPGLDLSRIDPRLMRNLTLDLRAVLAWDADNTDIDLWVTDPNGEKAYYAHPLTYQGGRMSRDFTAGYGPEEFSLRTAKPGRYEVRAHFYGHRQQIVSPYTTLMLRLSTGFGTPAQKDQEVILRLSEKNEGVLVGSIEVAGKGGK